MGEFLFNISLLMFVLTCSYFLSERFRADERLADLKKKHLDFAEMEHSQQFELGFHTGVEWVLWVRNREHENELNTLCEKIENALETYDASNSYIIVSHKFRAKRSSFMREVHERYPNIKIFSDYDPDYSRFDYNRDYDNLRFSIAN